jgi:predicted RND superfamily exporter protein
VSIHDRIEMRFESWGYSVCRHRWATTLGMLLVTLLLGAWIPQLIGDFSTESYLRAGDPALVAYDKFRDQFGRDDRILVGVNPPDVFDLAFLEKLRAFHRDLEREVPYLEEVTSLVNARWTRGEGDELIVDELLEDWPESSAELEALRARVLSNPLYLNTLISEDATFTTVTIKPFTHSTRGTRDDALSGFEDADPATETSEPEYLSIPETLELVAALHSVVRRNQAPDFPLHVLGGPVLGAHLRGLSTRDASVFVSAAIAIIAVVLLALFRRPSGVLLPLLVILASLVATAGAAAALGIPFSIVTQIVPAFLIAIGMCDSVHILAIVYRRLALGSSQEDAIAFALRHSGLAVVMTSLTTAGGLASFLVAEIAPVANLGIVSPLGVLLALAYTMTLLPALLAIVPLARPDPRVGEAIPGALDRVLMRAGDLATDHPWRVVIVTLVVLGVSLTGAVRIRFSHDMLRMLPESDPIRVAAELVDRELKGTSTVEVLVDSGRADGLHEPAVLNRIDAAMRYAESLDAQAPRVGKAISIVDLLREIHGALNEIPPSRTVLPQDRRLIAQELLLFENSGWDDLEDFSESQLRKARITLRVSSVDAILYLPFLAALEAGLREILGGDLPFQITGTMALEARTFSAVITSLARSYALALLIITPLMILLIGRLGRGLLSMIPNLVPVFLTVGFMGWMDITLNFSTLLVASIIIGVAVDDTIHFMHRFNRYYEAAGDARAAVRETLLTTGSAMFVTSVVLATSFGTFMLGTIRGTVESGLLIAFATIVAFLADVLLAPALMVLVTQSRRPRIPRAHRV